MTTAKWKLAKGKSWRQKLEQEHPSHGRVVTIPARMRKPFGSGTMVIPKPLDVDAIMRQVRKGKLVTQSQVRVKLAHSAGTDAACPMVTGIFIRIAAEAAEEDRQAGKKRITPYWRTIKDDGSLNQKFPGGAEAQATRLREEGFVIQPSQGAKPGRVARFEQYLVKL